MRRIVCLIMFALLLVGTLSLAFNVRLVRAQGETITINADGSISPPTASINTLDNVTYVLFDDINEGITVQRSNIVINGNGHTIAGANLNYEISLASVDNVTITNATITPFQDWAIYLDNSSGNNIIGNKCTTETCAGIWFNYSDNNILANNTFDGENGYEGVRLYYSSNNTLCGNQVTGYGFPADETSGFYLQFSYNNTLSGNDVSGNAQSIILTNSDNNTLMANNVSWGVSGGPGEAAPWGLNLELDSSSNNMVLDNNFTNSNGPGVTLSSAFNNTLVGNNISFNSFGVELSSSSGNVLSNNVIEDNDGYVIEGITVNGVGIELDSSSNNTIYHNNFINNTSQFYNYYSTNTWDNGYPSGGNYWSDYNGTDLYSGPYQNVTGSDGIGDTPYLIDANNTDNYPLMGDFSDFSVAQGIDVRVISNSTLSDFQFNGTALLFNLSVLNGTAAFCRLCVPTALSNGTLAVFVNGTQVQYNQLPSLSNNVNYLYFTYGNSTLPEFPEPLILIMFMAATLLVIAVYKKKVSRSIKRARQASACKSVMPDGV